MRISDWSSDVCSSDLVTQLLLETLGVGDVAQYRNEMTAPVLALGHLGNFDLAEKFLAILASLPHFAGPAAMCEQLRVDTLIESGLMLHAVEQDRKSVV